MYPNLSTQDRATSQSIRLDRISQAWGAPLQSQRKQFRWSTQPDKISRSFYTAPTSHREQNLPLSTSFHKGIPKQITEAVTIPRLRDPYFLPKDSENLVDEIMQLKLECNDLKSQNKRMRTINVMIQKDLQRLSVYQDDQKKLKRTILVEKMRSKYKEFKERLHDKDRQMLILKKNLKFTKTSELEVELEQYKAETIRMRIQIEVLQRLQEKFFSQNQVQVEDSCFVKIQQQVLKNLIEDNQQLFSSMKQLESTMEKQKLQLIGALHAKVKSINIQSQRYKYFLFQKYISSEKDKQNKMLKIQLGQALQYIQDLEIRFNANKKEIQYTFISDQKPTEETQDHHDVMRDGSEKKLQIQDSIKLRLQQRNELQKINLQQYCDLKLDQGEVEPIKDDFQGQAQRTYEDQRKLQLKLEQHYKLDHNRKTSTEVEQSSIKQTLEDNLFIVVVDEEHLMPKPKEITTGIPIDEVSATEQNEPSPDEIKRIEQYEMQKKRYHMFAQFDNFEQIIQDMQQIEEMRINQKWQKRYRKVNYADVEMIGMLIRYRLQDQGIPMVDMIERLIPHQSEENGSLSLMEMEFLVQQKPFCLNSKQSNLLARYLTEDNTEEHVYYDSLRKQQAEIVRSVIRKLVGRYDVFSEGEGVQVRQETYEIVGKFKSSMIETIRMFMGKQIQYQDTCLRSHFLSALKFCDLQLPTRCLEYLQLIGYQSNRDDVERVNYKQVLDYFDLKIEF